MLIIILNKIKCQKLFAIPKKEAFWGEGHIYREGLLIGISLPAGQTVVCPYKAGSCYSYFLENVLIWAITSFLSCSLNEPA